jgi:nitroimidazol reductase NimA-like FMN-containing flavoprotein (pyridoxamine 5'-phosphate oxidase superfamily)
MRGELSSTEIERLLRESRIGRIGCNAEGHSYLVPIAYAYDGECVYAQSADGMKVRTMRANPNVCFEVEDIRGISDWRTVIAWGTYEELWGSAEEAAARLLREHFADLPAEASAHPAHSRIARGIFYRLRLDRKTGRFERP